VEANGHYDDIKLKPDAKDLLEQQMQPGLVKADLYLVSSGPNYYIDALAARYKIDQKSFCRSVYKFNQRTGLIEDCVAIDDQDKADFVSKKKGRETIRHHNRSGRQRRTRRRFSFSVHHPIDDGTNRYVFAHTEAHFPCPAHLAAFRHCRSR
jgi:hypothetical protein